MADFSYQCVSCDFIWEGHNAWGHRSLKNDGACLGPFRELVGREFSGNIETWQQHLERKAAAAMQEAVEG